MATGLVYVVVTDLASAVRKPDHSSYPGCVHASDNFSCVSGRLWHSERSINAEVSSSPTIGRNRWKGSDKLYTQLSYSQASQLQRQELVLFDSWYLHACNKCSSGVAKNIFKLLRDDYEDAFKELGEALRF